jgi:hypothetical protein
MKDVPLDRKREIIVADLLEVSLLPPAAVNEGNVVLGETKDRIGLCEVRNDGIGVFAGIAHDVGHAGLAPTRVDLLMTSLAGSRSDVMPVIRRHYHWRGGRRRDRCRGRHRRYTRQVPDIAHQLPNLTVGQIPRGHAGVTDAIADMVKQLTVRRCRDGGRAQRRHPRKFVGTDGGFSAAVIGVTDLALLPVKVFSRRGIGRIGRWIGTCLKHVRHALMQQPGRENGLGGRRFGAGAREAGNHFGVENTKDRGYRCDYEKTPDEEFFSRQFSWHG